MQDRPWSRQEQAHLAREQIWQHVSPASTRAEHVVPLAAALLALPGRDVRFLAALHLLLSPECTTLLDHAPTLLRHLTTSTNAPLDEHPERVRGPVDWQATLALSVARGRRYAYATRPPERDYDTPENRLLRASLAAVTAAAAALDWKPSRGGAGQDVQHKADTATRLLGAPALRDRLAPLQPRDVRKVERGRASRRFEAASRFWRLHDALQRLQDHALLRQMVEATALLVTSDGALLEVLVLFDVLRSLSQQGWQRRGLGLVRGQVRITHTRGTETLDVHYQGTPRGLPSRYSRVLASHHVPSPGLRPDLVLDQRTSQTRAVTFVEVKYRARAQDAVRAALFDLLAYRDNYQGAAADVRLLGVGWGQGLSPTAGAEVLLCTPDYVDQAVALLH